MDLEFEAAKRFVIWMLEDPSHVYKPGATISGRPTTVHRPWKEILTMYRQHLKEIAND